MQNKSLFIGLVVIILIFVGLIFTVNGWIKRTLQSEQDELTTSPVIASPPQIAKGKDKEVTKLLMGGSHAADNMRQSKTLKAKGKVVIKQEAPILDKVLNE